ncbi:MAG: sulfotransferase domain-containing protein [Gemmatimonadota bacterium]
MARRHEVLRAHPALRKSASLLKQAPRFARRLAPGSAPGWALLANSVPKSGTHLLTQVLEAFPGVRNYDSFIASVPPVRFRERSRRTLLRRISWIAPGELVSAHLHYAPELAAALTRRRCAVFLLLRDPRDVAISEAHYLSHMNPWHRAHRYFAGLASDDERIMASIRGIPEGATRYRFPDLAARFEPFLGWLDRDDACAVRFEELRGPAAGETIRRMLAFVARRTGDAAAGEAPVEEILANVDPARSRTFRSGRVGGWRERLTPEHVRAVRETAGPLLIRLGYESDDDW